jgi:hypothetical protein
MVPETLTSARAFAAALAAVVCTFAQTPPRPHFDAFEVATIKPTDPNPTGSQSNRPLRATKGPVDALIIDHIERPSETEGTESAPKLALFVGFRPRTAPNLFISLQQVEEAFSRSRQNCNLFVPTFNYLAVFAEIY